MDFRTRAPELSSGISGKKPQPPGFGSWCCVGEVDDDGDSGADIC